MAYGHAERVVAAIMRLEAETAELLSGLDQLDPEQARWLEEVDRRGAPRRSRGCPGTTAPGQCLPGGMP